MSERDEFTATSPITAVEDPEGAGGLGPDEDPDEFVVRALERAQRVARNHGYIRSTLPSWGLDETRPRRTLDGSSEYAAIETDGLGRLAADGTDGIQARAAARAVPPVASPSSTRSTVRPRTSGRGRSPRYNRTRRASSRDSCRATASASSFVRSA